MNIASRRAVSCLRGTFLFAFLTLGAASQGYAQATRFDALRPVVRTARQASSSARLDALPPIVGPRRFAGGIVEREIEIRRVRPVTPGPKPVGRRDPVLQESMPSALAVPNTTLTFEGINNEQNAAEFGLRVVPPDTNGDIGGTQYVQAANLLIQVFDKVTGNPLLPPPPATPVPARISSLFAGFGGPCETTDDGDSIVLYDPLANRWLISQFTETGPPYHQCIAISKDSDATGAYYTYDFVMPNSKFNDYPKFGVWSDAYYMTDNQFSGNTWAGGGVFAFDRAKMLVGDPSASYIYFDLYAVQTTIGGMLPADVDGAAPPAGTPGYFAYFTSIAPGYNDPQDGLRIFNFHADFATPANSTFQERSESPIAVAAFDPLLFCGNAPGSYDCIPQPAPAPSNAALDGLNDRLMFRLQYRNFGTYETLVTNHTVDANGSSHAGVRYYILRRPLPSGSFAVNEQATYAPDSNHRWMASAALDRQGNLAVGFSVSSDTVYPSIRYAGRLANDPPNGLFQGETTLQAGSAVQTTKFSRWGDYSMMSVDPQDDCTFWYTSEYYTVTSDRSWQTRVGQFKFPQCTPLPSWTPGQTRTPTQSATPSISATPSATRTGTSTPSSTSTPPPTATRSFTPTASQTGTSTGTVTWTRTITPTNTGTITPTTTNTPLPSASPSHTPSPTNTPLASETPSHTATRTQTPTQSPLPTASPSSTLAPSNSPTQTPTQTGTITQTPTRTQTQLPSTTQIPTATQTGTVTITASVTSTITRTPTTTATVTLTPTITLTFTRTATITGTITLTPTPSPTITQTATITLTFTRTPTITPTITLTQTLSPTLTRTATITPTITNTSPPGLTPTQTPTPSQSPVSATVAGQILYFSNAQPVSGIDVAFLQGPAPTATISDVNGQYTQSLSNGDNWVVQPSHLGSISGVTAFDASIALQAAVGLIGLTPLQRVACDTNGSNTLTAIDATFILQLRVGLITHVPAVNACGSDWLFEPAPTAGNPTVTHVQLSSGTCQMGALSYSPLAGAQSGQDFTAILLADCNGSWVPPSGGGAALRSTSRVRFGRPRHHGDRMTVPVWIDARAAQSALEMEIHYDRRLARAIGVRRPAATQSALLAVNTQQAGTIKLALASASTFDTRQAVVLLRFESRRPLAAWRSLQASASSD